MSVINLQDVKQALRVIHSADDALIQQLIDSAEDEAVRFCGRTQLPTLPLDNPCSPSSEDVPSSEDPVVPSVFTAVVALVKADYEATVDEAKKLRELAEVKLMPYRIGLGV
ncbi:TPA: phage gp6-like head-tail connector protein [Pseudomonas aeruginosa]|nr:phage gp6-like head-tail connector protein [Pseudomonas aeruginosa]HEJ4188884.1 phage gp6-like head-tail connector protein [Pseudomonas aeruginosa]HEJ5576321.1 phage gp6-like head-tail connector protein [Pseudomonas aeruginosa]HEJ9895249.1 phage gp6-like head-tail connector protein [Pseudomonas aeruginosa]HEK0156613.1 phage gp6-like head-tail connector protein [Pseudomonas aeruginosa]